MVLLEIEEKIKIKLGFVPWGFYYFIKDAFYG